ncbi:pathogenesis-related homeodomain protein isoform X3 [Mangifera indica]|nr:pathogenesis-related homeodomain protein isoform X3 [Mangifera indica]XP_044464923.1 pathogenesis-related homeodomain protein isoform X3 [Mangifera indica]XP_044464924.1 pathogenesis-related homeodomain protein isoform X3 [Mangifera indica]
MEAEKGENIHQTGKKVAICAESSKSCFPKRDTGSELIASLKFKKGSNISKSEKLKSNSKSKSKSHVKLINSNMIKKKVTESQSKGTGNDSGSKKSISRKPLHKKLDKNSSRKLASLKLQGKNPSPVNSKGHGKVINGDVETKNQRKRKKKRTKEKVELDEASRLQRRTRYLLIKMKLEQNLIDAYSGEGWKGQSREKIRPERELLRAKKQILKCKLGIREAIRQLDSLSSVGSIEGSVIASDGSVHHEHIICAKCKLREAFPDNDIVLCDGTCNCAFHQKCLDPPLDTECIPPGDQGWFCRFCECKMEIIEAMNAHIGTCFSIDSNWQDIFKEEAAFPDGGSALLNQEQDWPSDDSEDDDYNPERRENSSSISGVGTDDDASSSTSLSWSSDGETFSKSMRWEMEGNDYKQYSSDSSIGSDENSDGEIICGRRQRRTVDYKKLYDEMFGKDALAYEQVSEDEDWGPAKRRRREKESDAVNTLMTLYGSEEKCPNVKAIEVQEKHFSDAKVRRPFFRIPPNAVEKLRQVFAENELPSRTIKDNLSKELGLEPEKVNKWFKNARYIALKTRKVEGGKHLHNAPKISKEPRLEDSLKKKVLCTPKNVKKYEQGKDSKLPGSGLKKNQRKKPSESPANSNQASVELSDDVSLRKLLKAKTKRDKRKVNFMTGSGLQAAEAEMERLCKVKDRLENLKQKLSRVQNRNVRKSSKSDVHDELVIYVPIVELREKV